MRVSAIIFGKGSKRTGCLLATAKPASTFQSIFTLLISTGIRGVTPKIYLKDFIERTPMTRPDKLHSLLPAN